MLQRAMQIETVQGATKAVLLNLAWHAADDGTEARPAIPTIAHEMGLGETSVKRALRELKRSGLITPARPPDRAKHLPTCYRIALPPGATTAPGSGGHYEPRPGATTAPNRQITTSLRGGGAKRAAPHPLDKYE